MRQIGSRWLIPRKQTVPVATRAEAIYVLHTFEKKTQKRPRGGSGMRFLADGLSIPVELLEQRDRGNVDSRPPTRTPRRLALAAALAGPSPAGTHIDSRAVHLLMRRRQREQTKPQLTLWREAVVSAGRESTGWKARAGDSRFDWFLTSGRARGSHP